MRYLLAALGIGGLLAGVLLYRRVTWRIETPMSEQRKAAFSDLEPRYRYRFTGTQWWKVNIRRERERKRA